MVSLAEEWGATVVIENKPGATGAIGAFVHRYDVPDCRTALLAEICVPISPSALSRPAVAEPPLVDIDDTVSR